jgi:iron(III) transport system substrate-binding protein
MPAPPARKVNMALKGSGEALAQLIAEKDNPKTDVWFGGTGDPHLQAAEQGLTLEYKSPTLPQLQDWAQQQAKQSGYKTVGIYSGPLGFGYNPELLAKKKLPVPQDLGRPAQARIQGRGAGGQPRLQRHGVHHDRHAGADDGRGQGLRVPEGLHRNVGQYTALGHRSRSRRWRAARPRCPSASCTTARARRCRASRSRPSRRRRHRRRDRLHEHHQGRAQPRGRQEVLRMGPHARRAGDGGRQQEFQLPSNKAAKVDPRVPDFKKIKFINYDYAKYGASAERRRLIARWEKDVNSLPR